tara:strand:+ start:95 stop:709 length:615 start_codon:yes stop_codon:yes gene_type:complete
MSNYFENLPDEIIDYIYLIRFRDDFKKTLNEINYKNLLLSGDKDALNKFYNGENWTYKFHHLNPDKDKISITIELEKKKGWLADMVKEKLNITMFKKYKKHLDDYECLAIHYKNRYNFIYSSVLTMVNGTLGYRSHLIYYNNFCKDDLKLMLRNNGYLNKSIPLEDQLCEADLERYYNWRFIIDYKYFYNSWTKKRLIKEIIKI